jgi:hypothetical protein
LVSAPPGTVVIDIIWPFLLYEEETGRGKTNAV